MFVLSKIDIKLNITDKNPTNTTYCVPNCDINNPPTAVPIVVPTLADVTNNPFAKSGASGAADVIQY